MLVPSKTVARAPNDRYGQAEGDAPCDHHEVVVQCDFLDNRATRHHAEEDEERRQHGERDTDGQHGCGTALEVIVVCVHVGHVRYVEDASFTLRRSQAVVANKPCLSRGWCELMMHLSVEVWLERWRGVA